MSEPQQRPNGSQQEKISPGGRYWLRGVDPSFGFVWKGLIPLAALIGLVLYAFTAFAARTEARVMSHVRQALLEHGYTWVNARTVGQDVNLSGLAPNSGAAQAAEALVRQVRCDTWVGALPCVSQVNAAFELVDADQRVTREAGTGKTAGAAERAGAAEIARDEAVTPTSTDTQAAPTSALLVDGTTAETAASSADVAQAAMTAPELAADARWYALRAVRTAKALRLTGEVPSKEMSSMLVEAAKGAVPGTLAVKSALTLAEGIASPGWEAAAKRLIDVMGKCTNGRADISSRKLEVNCEVADRAAGDALRSLSEQPIDELEVGKLNLLVLEDVTACEEALGKLLRRSQIRFATGSASLLPSSRPLLQEIASQLKDCPGVVVVEGHTDAQGVREQNVQLSENRAKAVVRVLRGAGVPKDRVRAEGFGPDRPLATNETATGRAQNRRIEFRVARTETSGE